MSQHLPGRPRFAFAAAAVSTVLVCGTAGPVMAAAPPPAGPLLTRATAAAARVPSATARVPAAAPLLLINGARVRAVTGQAGSVAIALVRGSGSAGLLTQGFGNHIQAIPIDALPYLGRGLGPGLFDLSSLRGAERSGRLPLRVTFRGHRPRLPGVTMTRFGAGYEDGYLTAPGARTFGAALARQYRGDHARASYGQDGLFGGGAKIALAGPPAAPAVRPAVRSATAARPAATKDTLTMSATNLQGRPDNGDFVIVHNEDNPLLLGRTGAEMGTFHNGIATFHVPAGHYWAEGVFSGNGGNSTRLVDLPQFTVHGPATVHLAERSASSKIEFTTPRPAVLQAAFFALFRGAGNGDLYISDFSGSGTSPLWIRPTTTRPTVGTLNTDTTAQLTSATGAPGTPYAYTLAYPGPDGLIPAQHFTAGPANLATLHENYYQDTPSTGGWCTIGGNVMPDGAFDFSCFYFPISLPGTQTQYLSTGPTAVWQTNYGETPAVSAGGQTSVFANFRPGQHAAVNWNAYPLHPQPDVQVLHGFPGLRFPGFPSAFRVGNGLTLSPAAFSDNYPGHFGTGFTRARGVTTTGSYTIDQDGTQIAGGSPARGIPPVQLSSKPSVITFTLTAGRQGSLFRFSPATTTTWAWHSAPRPGATVPQSWSCGSTKTGRPQRHCAVQPMMTLNYQIAGLALNGTTAAGPQTINLSVGHLQLAKTTTVTGATAKVSFNGGHTFRAATVTPQGGGRFRIGFTAPAEAAVTLRVSATDAAGGSVTETVMSAYGTAS